MLQHRTSVTSSVCSFGSGPKNLTNSICLLGQLILDQHSRCFGKFVYHVDTGTECSKTENVRANFHVPELTNSSLRDWPFGQHELRVPQHDRVCVVIEMLILNDTCSHHPESDKVSAFVVEQWTISYSPNSLTSFQADQMVFLQREIEGYFTSSPLSFWLREHFQSKRLRLFHRICSADTINSQLGVPFVTSLDQLFSQSPYVCPETIPVSKEGDRCSFDWTTSVDKRRLSSDAKLTSSFTPLPINPAGFLHLAVVTPERMPSMRPECPMCSIDQIEWDRSSAFPPRISDASFYKSPFFHGLQTDHVPRRSKNVSTLVDSPSFSNLSPSSVTYTETVQSPVVVITNVQRNFFSDDLISSPYYTSSHSVPCSELSNDSDTSTLTKKSRSVHNNAPPPVTLESPPRKQQRITSEDKGSINYAAEHLDSINISPTSHGLEHTHTGSIDRVISEFTQLNVERPRVFPTCGSHIHSSSFGIQSESSHFSSSNVGGDVPSVLDVGKNQEDVINIPNVETLIAMNPFSSKHTHGHLPRERRRNATSACIPFWPSSSVLRHGMPFFNRRTGLPLQSSPVPLKRSTSGRFDYDSSLCPLKTSRSSACMLHDCGPSCALGHELRHSGSSVRRLHQEGSSTITPLSSQATSASLQLRRRPASLRLNLPTTDGVSDRSLRRHICAPEVDQAEISCSAPPSGGRKTMHSVQSRTRLPNTLACTPASHCSSQHLLVNFEESMLNGRIHPLGQVDGFTLELGASGSFFPSHERIPLKTYFFDLSDDNKPSPYLAYADLSHLRSGKGYHLPSKGSVQLTLFNPNKFVVKMFVIGYDFEDMPPNSQTFLRQRTVYMPIRRNVAADSWKSSWHEDEMNTIPIEQVETVTMSNELASESVQATNTSWSTLKPSLHEITSPSQSISSCSCSSLSSLSSICSSASVSSNHTASSITSRPEQQVHLRYLVHLRFHTTRSGRLYLHTDLRLIFARERFEFDPRVATYELRSFIDAPTDPRYSPKKWTRRPRRNAARLVVPSVTA